MYHAAVPFPVVCPTSEATGIFPFKGGAPDVAVGGARGYQLMDLVAVFKPDIGARKWLCQENLSGPREQGTYTACTWLQGFAHQTHFLPFHSLPGAFTHIRPYTHTYNRIQALDKEQFISKETCSNVAVRPWSFLDLSSFLSYPCLASWSLLMSTKTWACHLSWMS